MNIELVIATFENDDERAEQVLQRVRELTKQKTIVLHNVATIAKTKDGKVRVNDVGDVKGKQGAVFGAITGALVGLVGGPVGAVAGAVAGAATGGATAKLADYGVSDKLIKEVQHGLQPGSSAIIVYLEIAWLDKAITMLEKNGAVVYHETIESNLDELIEKKRPDA